MHLIYFLAVVFPPLAVLLVGKPFQAFLNLILTFFGWLPGIIHAILVIKDKRDDKRMRKQVKLLEKSNRDHH